MTTDNNNELKIMTMNFYETNASELYDNLNDVCLEIYGKEFWLASTEEQEVVDTLVWSRSV